MDGTFYIWLKLRVDVEMSLQGVAFAVSRSETTENTRSWADHV